MKQLKLLLALVVAVGAANAQSVSRVRPVTPVAPPVPVTVAPDEAESGLASVPKDYQALYRKEVEKNRQLKSEVQSLTARLAEITRPGGSLVTAYCASASVSRNTAGAESDCSASGFGCEPVSGLCRTSARSSADCAVGFVYCVTRSNCVRTAEECQ